MKRTTSKYVYLTGSKKTLKDRMVYTDGNDFFIKWYGNYVKVYQKDGCPSATWGWRTVEDY